MFIVHPDIQLTSDAAKLVVENAEVSLTFEGDSAAATRAVLDHMPFCRTIAELEESTQFSLRTVESILDILQEDRLIIDLSDLSGFEAGRLCCKKFVTPRRLWNARCHCRKVLPTRLFAGEATWARSAGVGHRALLLRTCRK